VSQTEKFVLEALHREAIANMDEASRFAMQPRVNGPADGQLKVHHLMTNPAIPERSRQLVRNLLHVAPTEAAVERVFSSLKKCITDRRTRTHPGAATAAIIFNSSRKFLDCKESGKRLEDYPAVALSTWQWIVSQGCVAHGAKIATLSDLNAAEFVVSARATEPRVAFDLPEDRTAAASAAAAPEDAAPREPTRARSDRRRPRDEDETAAATTAPRVCKACMQPHMAKRGQPPLEWLTCTVCQGTWAKICVAKATKNWDPENIIDECWLCWTCFRRRKQLEQTKEQADDDK
jgi:hypothetical protein